MTGVTANTRTDPLTLDLLEALLEEQQTLPAVDRFVQQQVHDGRHDAAQYYRDLIPAAAPAAGQQYAFEVNLDACSGCKACVTACHSLNDLEEEEHWRHVGQLTGGTTHLPSIRHVTTACHHCVEPACLDGCPVEAYVKDHHTGIVHHLDDQCIGCQYCVLKCPYDVPVYSKSKGIVRKCDMCHQRLEVGEAPGCVQGCPNQAIRIRLVEQESILEESETSQFLPAAPDPAYTLPATRYKSSRPLPPNALPADYFSVQRAHAHLPLVFMLVLTQMSVGAFVVEQIVYSYFTWFQEEIAASVRPLHLTAAAALGLLGLIAAVFHLGRPLYAYRALLGWKTSWLSREIVAFGLFATASSIYVCGACSPLPELASWKSALAFLGFAASATGVLGVFCSVMIYVDTRRPCWRFATTAARFALTSLLLGIPVSLLIMLVGTRSDGITTSLLMSQYGRPLCRAILFTGVLKLLIEASALLHLGRRQHTPQKRAALLLTGELGMHMFRRVFFGVIGGLVLPVTLLAEQSLQPHGYHPWFVGTLTTLMLAVLVIGELHERYLFFVASVAPKMPGTPAI